MTRLLQRPLVPIASVEDAEATAIAFRPRPGGRLVQFLSSDIAIKLVTNDRHPVVALPAPAE